MSLGEVFIRAFVRGLGYRAARAVPAQAFNWLVLVILLMLGGVLIFGGHH